MRFVIERFVALGLTSLSLCGCAASAKRFAAEAPHEVIPATVDETLKAGEDPQNRERLAQIMASPEMEEVIKAMAKTAVSAAFEELSEEESKARLVEITRELTRAMSETVAVSMQSKVAPAAGKAMVRELNEPELHEAVADLVGDATRKVVAGMREEVVQTAEKAEKKVEGRPAATLVEKVGKLLSISWILAFAFGVAVIGTIAWVARLKRRNKRYRVALIGVIEKEKGGAELDEARLKQLVELLQ